MTKNTDDLLFKNPGSEYRAAPFWAWNNKLEPDELKEQIKLFKEMGFGGFFMHSRTGMATPYLSAQFMKMVNCCIEEAKKNNMKAFLYDEDRYPSGQAGGLAIKDNTFRRRYVILTEESIQTEPKEEAFINGNAYLIGTYELFLTEKGLLKDYNIIKPESPVQGKKVYAYCLTEPNTTWYNNKCRIDSMRKEAVDEFIRITYGTYKTWCSKHYGKTVPAIFTDEPHVHFMETVKDNDNIKAACPWTYDLPDYCIKHFNCNLEEKLPELFFDRADGKICEVRYFFWRSVSEMFNDAYMKNCASRAEKDGLSLTGHIMREDNFRASTGAMGDGMLPYKYMHIPGIDMLGNPIEYETAIKCRSIVRQEGKKGMLSELYGVTDYDFGFRGYKFQGDWQAAMGVTQRVTHLAWLSMEGNAKRDYPSTFNYQAPWAKDYKYLEDHFARINAVLSSRKSICNIAVINAQESFWLDWGPETTSSQTLKKYDNTCGPATEHFTDMGLKLTKTLMENNLDFDYISESVLPSQKVKISSSALAIGKSSYKAIVINNIKTLRKTTADILYKFASKGGKVIIAGSVPEFTDLQKKSLTDKLISVCECIEDKEDAILNALEPFREVSISSDRKLYSLKEDKDCRYLFVANTNRDFNTKKAEKERTTIKIKGKWEVIFMNTQDGSVSPLPYEIKDNETVFEFDFYPAVSLLVKLNKLKKVQKKILQKQEEETDVFEYSLHEKMKYNIPWNTFLLDRAQWSLNNEEFNEEESVMTLDNLAREKAGLPARSFRMIQPWCAERKEDGKNKLNLRFSFESLTEVRDAMLAIENPNYAFIYLNNKPVDKKIYGFFTDKCISLIKLPAIKKGTNILDVSLPLHETSNTENLYIIGKFGVKNEQITTLPKYVNPGNLTDQGFEFFGHNFVYLDTIVLKKDQTVRFKVSSYCGQVIKVMVDGKTCGYICYAPYELKTKLEKGTHKIEIILEGSLVNTFGALHYCGTNKFMGPDCWISSGENYTKEYLVRPFGINC